MTTLAPQPPVPTANNGPATTALVVGIIALMFCWVPLIGFLLAATAVTFAVVGLRRVRDTHATGHGLSVAGLVLGVISGVIATIITAGVFLAAAVSQDVARDLEAVPTPGSGQLDSTVATITQADAFTAGVDGTYIVGRDVQPGTYITAGARPGIFELCTVQTFAGGNAPQNTTGGDLSAGQIVLNVAATDTYVKTAGCKPFDAAG